MPSPAQILANQQNAQLSTGPVTAEGKAKSSLNAVKTGLTGRTILLASDDAEAYTAHVARFESNWKPGSDVERTLVQSLADTEWRLLRIPVLEAGIYALGRREFGNRFEDEDTQAQAALIDTFIFQTYRRDFSNLSIQESRLRRQRDKDTETLIGKQRERSFEEAAAMRENVSNLATAKRELMALEKRIKKAERGFEFANGQSDNAAYADLQKEQARAQAKVRFYTGVVNKLLFGPSYDGPADSIGRVKSQWEAA